MRKRMLAASLATATLAGLTGAPSPAGAETCTGDVTEIRTPAAVFYIDVRTPPDLIAIPSPFIYMESNGVTGLQRGGTSILLVLRDACNGPNPDQFIA